MVPAERAAVADDAALLDAVGPCEDEGQRQGFHRLSGVVAGKGGGVDGFAGAVDAALGPGEDVECAGGGAASDAAVGEIEAGGGHVEEDEIAFILRRRQHGGRHGRGAAHEAGGEHGAALRVGSCTAENFVVAGQKLELDAWQRLGAGERAGEDGKTFLAGEGRQADIRDNEPLRRLRGPAFALVAFGRGGQNVDAGFALGQCLGDWEAGGDVLVERGAELDRAFPD